MTATTPPQRSGWRTMWIVLICGAVVLVVAATIVAAIGGDGDTGWFEQADSANGFDETEDEIGSDLGDLFVACDDGNMEACDDLYWESPVGSFEEEFGSTCGDRTTIEYDGDCEDEF